VFCWFVLILEEGPQYHPPEADKSSGATGQAQDQDRTKP